MQNWGLYWTPRAFLGYYPHGSTIPPEKQINALVRVSLLLAQEKCLLFNLDSADYKYFFKSFISLIDFPHSWALARTKMSFFYPIHYAGFILIQRPTCFISYLKYLLLLSFLICLQEKPLWSLSLLIRDFKSASRNTHEQFTYWLMWSPSCWSCCCLTTWICSSFVLRRGV